MRVAELQARVAEFMPLVEKCGKLKAQCDAKRTEAGALDGVIKQIAELRGKEECTGVRLAELDQAIRDSSQKEDGLQRLFEKVEEVLKSLEGGDLRFLRLDSSSKKPKSTMPADSSFLKCKAVSSKCYRLKKKSRGTKRNLSGWWPRTTQHCRPWIIGH